MTRCSHVTKVVLPPRTNHSRRFSTNSLMTSKARDLPPHMTAGHPPSKKSPDRHTNDREQKRQRSRSPRRTTNRRSRMDSYRPSPAASRRAYRARRGRERGRRDRDSRSRSRSRSVSRSRSRLRDGGRQSRSRTRSRSGGERARARSDSRSRSPSRTRSRSPSRSRSRSSRSRSRDRRGGHRKRTRRSRTRSRTKSRSRSRSPERKRRRKRGGKKNVRVLSVYQPFPFYSSVCLKREKRERRKNGATTAAVGNQWGKYGIISESECVQSLYRRQVNRLSDFYILASFQKRRNSVLGL